MPEPVVPPARPADLARDGRVDARPPTSELATALLGESGLLVPLAGWGGPQQLFWPRPDRYANHAGFALGLATDDGAPVVWLHDLPAVQRVDDDADLVTTRLMLDAGDDGGDGGAPAGVGIAATIDPDARVGTAALVLDVRCDGAAATRALVVDLTVMIGGTERTNATLVDPSGVLLAYRQDRVLALAAARSGQLLTCGIDPPGPQTTTRAVRVTIPPGEATTLVLALAHDHAGAVGAARVAASRAGSEVGAARRAVDAARASSRTPTLVEGTLDVLDRAGLRVLRALQAPEGGVLAAPECDPGRRRSGGYGFVWARDLAFIVTAAAVAGQRDIVDGALAWFVRAQSADGLYEQRHWSDGRVAPTWGLQLDETGAALHAIGEVARVLADPQVVERCWGTVRRTRSAPSIRATRPSTHRCSLSPIRSGCSRTTIRGWSRPSTWSSVSCPPVRGCCATRGTPTSEGTRGS